MFRHHHRPKTYKERAYFAMAYWWLERGVNEWEFRSKTAWRAA